MSDEYDHRRLFGLFPAPAGWTRGEPQGRSMPGTGGIMARCEYRHPTNDQWIVAKIVVGTLGQAMLRTLEATQKAQQDPPLVQAHRIAGVGATLFRDTVTKDQWVLTSLLHADNNAVLNISFQNVPPEQCLVFAELFNWQTLVAEVRLVRVPKLYRALERPL